MSTSKSQPCLFSPGRIVYPPRVQRALRRAGLYGVALLARHLAGDWGQVDLKRTQVNRWAIAQAKDHNKPVISRFALSTEVWVFLITRHPHTPGWRETSFVLSRETDTQPRPKTGLVNRNSQAKPHPSRVRTIKTGRVK